MPLASQCMPHAQENSVAQSFLAALENAHHNHWPFDYWLLQDILPDGFANAIAALPFAPPNTASFDGRRESNNATRVYFCPDNQARFKACEELASGFKSIDVIKAIEQNTGTDLHGTRLRIEYCQDTEGFWLEPHTDISAKKFTMLVYLGDDPALENAGTDIHCGPPDFEYVASAPYGLNKGVLFIPGAHSWHAVGKRRIEGIRKSIIINYVDQSWRDVHELA